VNQDGPPQDHVHPDDDDTDTDRKRLEENLKSKSTWVRVFFMLVVVILYGVSRVVLAAVVVLQICYALITGSPHRPLTAFGKSLAIYTYEIVMYLTFNSDERPFPFDADWPTEPGDAPSGIPDSEESASE
jgi:hypothetical protein